MVQDSPTAVARGSHFVLGQKDYEMMLAEAAKPACA